ncbi:MAG: hypothetical protein QXY45_00550 [Candidatus Aenigmatarchaeota archaeon]
MNTMVKLLIGVVLLVLPLGMYVYELINGVGNGITLPIIGRIHMWKSLAILLVGSVPGFVMLIGLFVVWLELDEMRIERELKKEEEKEEKEEKEESEGKRKRGRPKKK